MVNVCCRKSVNIFYTPCVSVRMSGRPFLSCPCSQRCCDSNISLAGCSRSRDLPPLGSGPLLSSIASVASDFNSATPAAAPSFALVRYHLDSSSCPTNINLSVHARSHTCLSNNAIHRFAIRELEEVESVVSIEEAWNLPSTFSSLAYALSTV